MRLTRVMWRVSPSTTLTEKKKGKRVREIREKQKENTNLNMTVDNNVLTDRHTDSNEANE